ncbi:unnamed protein product [Pleuronectes platessa]|uniref:Uncharacterized protein n=1 Tax=Pleuronectes platessa TaxID=8262 RepID=A0A9N7UIG0_PLEPL|nr:unnamed protein product [Pleuronectes platessa]
MESGDPCSENESELNVEGDSAIDEKPDEDEENCTSFTSVAFRFRKARFLFTAAYDRPTPLKHSSSKVNLNEGNIQEAAESLDEEEVMPYNERNVEEAAEVLPHTTNTMRFIFQRENVTAGERTGEASR